MDGQTREGEASGMKTNQPVRHGSPKGVFSGRKHHKPRLSLDNTVAVSFIVWLDRFAWSEQQ